MGSLVNSLLNVGTGTVGGTGNFLQGVNMIRDMANIVLGVVGVAVIFVAIWLAFKFFTAEDEEKRKNAKGQMIYAIIGVVAVLAIVIIWNALIAPIIMQQTGPS